MLKKNFLRFKSWNPFEIDHLKCQNIFLQDISFIYEDNEKSYTIH